MAKDNEPKSGPLGSALRALMASRYPTWPRSGVQKAVKGKTMQDGLANGFPLGSRRGDAD
jgi:hypothetical protein